MTTTPYYSPKLTHGLDTWSGPHNVIYLCAEIIDSLYSIDHKKVYWIAASDKPPRHNHWFKVSKKSINYHNDYLVTRLQLTSARGERLREPTYPPFSVFLTNVLTHFDNPNYIYLWLEQYK